MGPDQQNGAASVGRGEDSSRGGISDPPRNAARYDPGIRVRGGLRPGDSHLRFRRPGRSGNDGCSRRLFGYRITGPFRRCLGPARRHWSWASDDPQNGSHQHGGQPRLRSDKGLGVRSELQGQHPQHAPNHNSERTRCNGKALPRDSATVEAEARQGELQLEREVHQSTVVTSARVVSPAIHGNRD